jgi:hypothetical protein
MAFMLRGRERRLIVRHGGGIRLQHADHGKDGVGVRHRWVEVNEQCSGQRVGVRAAHASDLTEVCF